MWWLVMNVRWQHEGYAPAAQQVRKSLFVAHEASSNLSAQMNLRYIIRTEMLV